MIFLHSYILLRYSCQFEVEHMTYKNSPQNIPLTPKSPTVCAYFLLRIPFTSNLCSYMSCYIYVNCFYWFMFPSTSYMHMCTNTPWLIPTVNLLCKGPPFILHFNLRVGLRPLLPKHLFWECDLRSKHVTQEYFFGGPRNRSTNSSVLKMISLTRSSGQGRECNALFTLDDTIHHQPYKKTALLHSWFICSASPKHKQHTELARLAPAFSHPHLAEYSKNQHFPKAFAQFCLKRWTQQGILGPLLVHVFGFDGVETHQHHWAPSRLGTQQVAGGNISCHASPLLTWQQPIM